MKSALTVDEFGEAVGISPSAVRRRIAAGQVRVSNIGSSLRPKLRIRISEVERYLSATELKPRQRKATRPERAA